MTPAQEWGNELGRAMRKRKFTQVRLATDVYISRHTIRGWLIGRNLPDYETAIAISEVLGWNRLRSMIIEMRTRTCIRCGAAFIVKRMPDAVYCSTNCRTYKHWRKRSELRSAENKERVGRTLALWEAEGGIRDRMCREWCAGGREDHLCPDASCPIQEAGKCPWPVARGLLEAIA